MDDDHQESDAQSTRLENISDIATTLTTGIPAPLVKGALKVVKRFCIALLAYPTEALEGRAAERRAESQARIKLIGTSAQRIAKDMRAEPAYVEAAMDMTFKRIVRERQNIDRITKNAMEDLSNVPSKDQSNPSVEPPEISEDWLNAFEAQAGKMSSEGMQLLFGRILAGEIRQPASYSIKTVELMATLDNRAAQLFKKLCSLSVSTRYPSGSPVIDARVVAMGNAGDNALLDFGLGFAALNTLHEYGLIISDYNSYADYGAAIVVGNTLALPIHYAGSRWALTSKVEVIGPRQFRLEGVRLSDAGRELLTIVDIEEDASYSERLNRWLETNGFTLTKL